MEVNGNNIGIAAELTMNPSIVLSGAPTSETPASVGQLYMNKDNGDLYKCTAFTDGAYVWEKVGGGGSGGSVEGDVLKGVITSGNIVTIDDASSIPHTLDIAVSGVNDPTAVTVEIYGENILDYRNATGRNASQTVEVIDDGVVWKAGGNYYFVIPCNIPANTKLSFDYKSQSSVEGEYVRQYLLRYVDNTTSPAVYPFSWDVTYPRTIISEKPVTGIYLYKSSPTTALTADLTVTDIQMVVGDTIDGYVPFVEPTTCTADENGVIKGIESVSPSMTIISNNPDAVLTVTYQRDVTSVVNALEKSEKELQYASATMPFEFSHLRPFAINHRGYNSIAPENTLPAFRLSKQKGFDFVESDILFTSDGVPVLLHDDAINRTARNADGSSIADTVNIGDITYEQALSYDFGIWKSSVYAGAKIPTFEEFVVVCKNLQLFPYIELKHQCTTEQLGQLVSILEKHGMIRAVSWISFVFENLRTLSTLIRNVRIGYLTGSPDTLEIILPSLMKLKDNGANVFVDFNFATYTDDVLSLCAENGLPLEVYGISKESDILAVDPVISGFTTDTINAKTVLYNANIGETDTGK